MVWFSTARQGIVCLIAVCGGVLWSAGAAQAGDEKAKDTASVVDQIGTTVKNAATTIEREITGVVKKLEESETPKKVGNELKRSADALGEKVEQAGKRLKESFKSE
jgi:hypothetical protein